jgi:hypothetical protein
LEQVHYGLDREVCSLHPSKSSLPDTHRELALYLPSVILLRKSFPTHGGVFK